MTLPPPPTDAAILHAFDTQEPMMLGARGRVRITWAKYEFYRGKSRLNYRSEPAPLIEGNASGD